MEPIAAFTKEELARELMPLGLPAYAIKQLWTWIYYHGKRDFESMTNLSKAAREQLTANYSLERNRVLKDLISKDGTRKWLVELKDGETIEVVYIPAEDRGTLCISSQVGCPMGCRFCNTGSQGFTRNLTVDEIVNEVLMARDYLDEWNSLDKAIGEGRKISNIVIMGMGEPLLNYDNIVKALKIINDPDGIAFSNRRITLSTCGIVPQIYRLADDVKINLAISLHATSDAVRKKIMPIANEYSLDEIMRALSEYARKTGNRRITFEYIMIKGLNDAEEDARRLINLVKKYNVPAKFNLIPFNPWQGCVFKEASSNNTVHKFAKILTDAQYPCPIRHSRGDDIMAACGQLKSKNLKGSAE